MKDSTILSPGLSVEDRERVRRIAEFWNDYATCGDSGETSREVLEELQQEVTDCLYGNPPDIDCAEGLTARAMLLIAGYQEL